MLSWIERVVPQPPAPQLTEETPPAPVQDPEPVKAPLVKTGGSGDVADHARAEETEKKAGAAVPEEPSSVFESMGSSVFSWLSQGLEKVIPQPVPPPGVQQGLGKSFEMSIDIPEQTEVQIDEDEEEEVVEIAEEELDGCELEVGSDTGTEEWAGARVLSWLVQGFEKIVPQPEMPKKPEPEPKEQKCEATAGGTKGTKTRKKAKSKAAATQSTQEAVEPAPPEVQPEPVATVVPQPPPGDGNRMFAWLVQGLEKVMPQPVTREKQDAQGVAAATLSPVEERSKGA